MRIVGSGQLDDTDGSLEVGEQGVFLNEYAIGKQGDVFPEGSGRLIKAGTKINFQLHLHSTGKEDTPTNVALGLKFYPDGLCPAARDFFDHGERAAGRSPAAHG